MLKHRITFLGVWMAFAIALSLFPRDLAIGMIIGGWPAAISKPIYESQFHHPYMCLLLMVVLSGTTVGLLAWLLDRAGMPKRIWILLGLSIAVGSAVFAATGLSFEGWKNTQDVMLAMGSPEVDYQPSRWDFTKRIIIPQTLVGGLWGLYGITGICALWAGAALVNRRLNPDKAMQTDGDSAPLHSRR